MTQEESKIVELLNDKKNILEEILDFTLTSKLEASKDFSERYIGLINHRESLFSKLKDIDSIITLPSNNVILKNGDNGFKMEVKSINIKIKEMVNKLIELDKKNSVTADEIFGEIKFEIKKINDGKSVNNKYTNFDYPESSNYDFSN